MGKDDVKEDIEEVLEELEISKTEEEKNVETSDQKPCDNDPKCVLPDLSQERDNERGQEASSQQKELVPPDKTCPSSQDDHTQDGDKNADNDLIQSQEDCQQLTESMKKLHDNIIPLDYYPSMITHKVTNPPMSNHSFVSHVKFSYNNIETPTYLSLFEVRDKVSEVSSIPVQTHTLMKTECSNLSNTVQITSTSESRNEPINPLLPIQIPDHISFTSHITNPQSQENIHMGEISCINLSLKSFIQSTTSLLSHVITNNGHKVSSSISVPSHQVYESTDPISWSSTSSLAHCVQIGNTLEKGVTSTSSTMISHYVAENSRSQCYPSFMTHQASCRPKQEHSFIGHMAVNENTEGENCASIIAHRLTCLERNCCQEPGNLMSPVAHRIDNSYEKPLSISSSFQTHLINNNYLNNPGHSSIAHQSPSASMAVLCESPQLTGETVFSNNRSSHVSHQSPPQPPPFTGSLTSHQVSGHSSPVLGEGCIKSEGCEIINKSEVESISDGPDTTVISNMTESIEASSTTHSGGLKFTEPIYAELQHGETEVKSPLIYSVKKKESEPIYATIIKSKKETKGEEQRNSDSKKTGLSLENIEPERLVHNDNPIGKKDNEERTEKIDDETFESRKSVTEVEIGDRDVSAVNKDNYVRENEKKESESSETLVPSQRPKNEDNRITPTKDSSNLSCESRERNIVRRNSKKAKRSASMKSEAKQQNKALQKSTSSESMKQRFKMYSIKPKEQEEEPKPVATPTPPSPNRKARPPVLRNFHPSKFTDQNEEQKSKYLPPPRMRKSSSNVDEVSQKPKKPERKKNRRSFIEDSEQSAESPTPSDQKQDTTTFEFKFIGSNTSVQVVGNFNGWIPEDLFMNSNGLWSKHIELSDGIYFFR